MRLTKPLKQAILAHAQGEYPKECCGLIVDGTYHPCTNVAPTPHEHFAIDSDEFIALEGLGEVQAIVHSHPDGEPIPSEADKVQMGLHGVDWVICALGVSITGQAYHDIRRHKPTSYLSPLLGREYIHGLQDCYSLIKDYYDRELDITLPDFPRTDGWWEDPNHEALYENNFTTAGFVQVHDVQKHDVILCRVGRTHHVNHALIYLGDGKLTSERADDIIGNSIVLHHPHGALSRREIYGDSWQKRTVLIVRHKQLDRD